MTLSKKQRELIRSMFGGKCAYCGAELDGRWHVDHVQPLVRKYRWERVQRRFVHTGESWSPENDRLDNLWPSCIKCNILKGPGDPETLRTSLAYMAKAIQEKQNYSFVQHLIRYQKIEIDEAPIVFWFEQFVPEVEA